MELLHQQFPWIPGQESIRPNLMQIEAKHATQRDIETLYETYLDFVLIEIFGFPVFGVGPKRQANCGKTAPLILAPPPCCHPTIFKVTKVLTLLLSRSLFSSPINFRTLCLRARTTMCGGPERPCSKPPTGSHAALKQRCRICR